MRPDFNGVTPEQLAQLFPIFLEEHDPAWAKAYAQEVAYLRTLPDVAAVRVSHIGSTAVPGLPAKPTVDILLEVSEDTDIDALTERMLDAGYVVNRPAGDLVLLIKGYTPRGFEGQAVHVHVRRPGDWGELYFRDYLIAHPEVSTAYAALKKELAPRYRHDRDGYTDAKADFVEKYTALGRAAYPGRYKPENHR